MSLDDTINAPDLSVMEKVENLRAWVSLWTPEGEASWPGYERLPTDVPGSVTFASPPEIPVVVAHAKMHPGREAEAVLMSPYWGVPFYPQDTFIITVSGDDVIQKIVAYWNGK